MPRILVLALALLAAACGRPVSVDTDTIGPGYAVGGGNWSTGGGITVVSRVFERNGVTVVCGAWATDRQSTLTEFRNEGIMETGSVYAGGRRLVHNLSFMARVPYSDNISGRQANCIASAVPWREPFAATPPTVRIPPFETREDHDVMSPGRSIIFREGPRTSIVH